jgi:hypothetical protein
VRERERAKGGREGLFIIYITAAGNKFLLTLVYELEV